MNRLSIRRGAGLGLAALLSLATLGPARAQSDDDVAILLAEIDGFVEEAAKVGEISAVARSGTVAVSKGEVTLTSFDRQHLLVG